MTQKSSNEILKKWFWNTVAKKPIMGHFKKSVDDRGFVTLYKVVEVQEGIWKPEPIGIHSPTNWIDITYDSEELLMFNLESRLRNMKNKAEKELKEITDILKDMIDYNIAKELENERNN